MDHNEYQKAIQQRMVLDKYSSSFCTVKWKHATLNLGSGAVKSCCHLPFRKVEMGNTAAGLQLHDTQEDRLERAMMLRGEQPKDCSYCWWMEKQGHLSDRVVWSSKSWMAPYTEEVGNAQKSEAQNPSWVELNFSNVCSLKCSYCSPIFSTKWLQEVREHGPYPTIVPHNDVNYLQGVELDEKFDNTELMKQFWPWFESAYQDLRLLKITGGEPFLSPQTFKTLQWVAEHPQPQLNLSINSNLTVPEANWDRFIELYQQIRDQKAVEKFYLHPSIDCYGARAEYIRHGLDFAKFKRNVEQYLEETGGHLVFICTINNLALGGLKEFWQYLLGLKKKYGPRGQWVSVTSEVLIGPEWQNINILPESFERFLQETIDFIRSEQSADSMTGFSSFELMGVERALQMMRSKPTDLESARKNFYLFFKAHDQRRGTDILETFPEIREFWHECGRAMVAEPVSR